jgi:hypothetical protein
MLFDEGSFVELDELALPRSSREWSTPATWAAERSWLLPVCLSERPQKQRCDSSVGEALDHGLVVRPSFATDLTAATARSTSR